MFKSEKFENKGTISVNFWKNLSRISFSLSHIILKWNSSSTSDLHKGQILLLSLSFYVCLFQSLECILFFSDNLLTKIKDFIIFWCPCMTCIEMRNHICHRSKYVNIFCINHIWKIIKKSKIKMRYFHFLCTIFCGILVTRLDVPLVCCISHYGK